MVPDQDGPLSFEPDEPDTPDAAREADARRGAEPGAQRSAGGRGARRSLPAGPDLATHGRPRAGEPPRARWLAGASRHGWLVGVMGVLLVALVARTTFRGGSSERGRLGVARGAQAPPFAAPLALSRLDGDVNVAVRRGQGDAGSVAACSVRGPDILNACALWELGPVVLAFFATRGADCVRQLDLLDEVVARHPRVRFAAISIRGNRDDLRRTIRARRWRFPVGYDADGVLASAYGVADCPQVTFLRTGGRVADTSLGRLGAAELARRVGRLDG